MTAEVSGRIAKIIDQRQQRLPSVERSIRACTEVDDRLKLLRTLAEELSAAGGVPVASMLQEGLQRHDLRARLATAVDALRVVQRRFERHTINIGVSGQARVGKSTLLQSIAGLTDEQVPTGDSLPVTAVRSRITHNPARRQATLTLHNFSSFREEVLQPYHRDIGLDEAPGSLNEFRGTSYPDTPLQGRDFDQRISLLERLKAIHASLASFEKHMQGCDIQVKLDELRPFVAYPTPEREQSGSPPRPYLAVRDVLIECPFPQAQVERLMLVDLPGLGEVASEAEKMLAASLKHEVDLVLVVKRALTGVGFWGEADSKALGLLQEARGAISRRGDFAIIVVNRGDPRQTADLVGHIHRHVNDGTPNKHYRVLECDARNSSEVYDAALGPALDHLAERLPAMDGEVYADALDRAQRALSDVHETLARLGEEMLVRRPENANLDEILRKRALDLHKRISSDLVELVGELWKKAYPNEIKPDKEGKPEEADKAKTSYTEFAALIETQRKEVEVWVANGFGQSIERWRDDALMTMRSQGGPGAFSLLEHNRIRVSIAEQLCGLDRYLQGQVDAMLADIVAILTRRTGALVPSSTSPRESLFLLAQSLQESIEPCDSLARAIRELLEFKIDYRTQLHPQVRHALNVLRPSSRLDIEVSDAGTQKLEGHLRDLTAKALYRISEELLSEASTPARATHAAAEHFEDVFSRGGDAELEFVRIARVFRDDLWPGDFSKLEARNARVARLTKAFRELLAASDVLKGSVA